jgi:hypothetical protein
MRLSALTSVVVAVAGVIAAPMPQQGGLDGLFGLLGGLGGAGGGFDLWSFVKNIPGPDLRFLSAIFFVPNIEKYVPTYLDWRNISAVPFIGPMAFGPAPSGCSRYEILIGKPPCPSLKL